MNLSFYNPKNNLKIGIVYQSSNSFNNKINTYTTPSIYKSLKAINYEFINDNNLIPKGDNKLSYKTNINKIKPIVLSNIIYTNDLFKHDICSNVKTPVDTIDVADLATQISIDSYDRFPLFFKQDYLIKIPKVERYIRRNIPRQRILSIYPDFETSIELCLLYISQVTSTYFDVKRNQGSEGWKFLKAKYLQELVGGDATCYKRIREVLEYHHPINGQLLECDYVYSISHKSYGHRINKKILLKGVVAYKLKSDYVRKQWYSNQLLSYTRAIQNPIAKNLILMYPNVELPTLAEVKKEAKRLVKAGYVTKKGKLLTFLNKHPNTYFKNHEQRSFVEDAIEIYDYLVIKNGLMIPQPSEDNAGGRVYDSLNLLPTWIRSLVKYKGEPIVELDYSCLHPNIACSLYGGNSEYLKHIDLVEELGLSVEKVKKEHLSFFNKKVVQMKQSPLFEYYNKLEPCMMQNIINDKIYNSEYKHKRDKHKITSKRMFNLEVKIMTEVINKINTLGIHAIYVFDALYAHPNDVETVKHIMNQTALNNNVKTHVKM